MEDKTKNISKPITIGETIDRYNFLRDDVAGNAVKDLFEIAISKTNDGGYIRNDTYFHALFLTEMMFERTSKSLRIFCGRDVATFLNTIDKAFFACCERIMKNNGILRIVSQVFNKDDEDIAFEQLKKLATRVRATYNGIDFKGIVIRDETSEKLNHFIACDSKMLRLEDLHEPLEGSMPASNIKAKVFFDNPGLSKEYARAFDESYQF